MDRVLCRLCECPVVDGGVQASRVDEERFDEWCLNFLGRNLAEKLAEDDVICYFCVWDADMLLKSHEQRDVWHRLIWWPAGLRETNDLKNNYVGEKVKPCWVSLDKLALPESKEEEENLQAQGEDAKNTCWCIYCAKFLRKSSFNSHMRTFHGKIRIRCDVLNCRTYFHTLQEKEAHTKECHEKPRERKNFDCIYCAKRFVEKATKLREHTESCHSDVAIGCNVYRCVSYFKTQAELDSHFESKHREAEEKLKFSCEHCAYKTNVKYSLQTHVTMKHLPKAIECAKCDKSFSCESILGRHMKLVHMYKVCRFCKADVAAQLYWNHFKRPICRTCRTKFDCLGLMLEHVQQCRQTQFKCLICEKSFKQQCLLDYHVRMWHQNLGSAVKLKKSSGEKGGFACAHCPKICFRRTNLCLHLHQEHQLLENKYECFSCDRKFFYRHSMVMHMRAEHNLGRKFQVCKLCGTLHKYLATHMLRIHGMRGQY